MRSQLAIFAWSVVIALVLLGTFGTGRPERVAEAETGTTEQPAPACKPNDQMPAIMAKRFVEKRLRAPSTASFPWMPEQQAYIAECTWQVRSYVDAQNGFGATVRTAWLITMVYDPATKLWSHRDLQME